MTISPESSALDIAAAIRTGEASPVEVAEMYLDRIEGAGAELNAIVQLDRDDVLRRARDAEARLRTGEARPFEGVPLPIKDLSDVAGQPNTMGGSLAVSDAPRETSDIEVRLFEGAGFVLLGRSNTPEFAVLTAAENARYGETRNPWNLDFTPGGSSGGAAAAVAGGLAPIAHASDSGGSIRVPAAATGLVGLKPSRGRVPAEASAWGHGMTTGVVTRTVADTAAALDALSPFDPHAWYSAPRPRRPFSAEVGADTGRLRIGLVTTPTTGLSVDDAPMAAAVAAARELEALGHIVEPAEPFMFTRDAFFGYVETIIDASMLASPWEDIELLEPYVRHRVERARTRHSGDYARAIELLERETRTVAEQFGRDFDLLLMPTMAVATPPVGLVRGEANADPDGPRITEARMVSFTAWVNIAGLPAISLPVHTDERGLPVGAQLVGGPFDEASLIRVAAQLEAVFEWQRRLAPWL